MAKIVFWSPLEGESGTTHTIVAAATLMGVIHKAKCILMQANEDSKKIESSYTPYDQLVQSGVLTSTETGIGALLKIIVSNKLSASTIKNYAKPVLKERLDILYGNMSKVEDQYESVIENFPIIAKRADEIYDLVFIDCPKGTKNKKVLQILADADVVVCTLNQDVVKFTEFFDAINKVSEIKDKPKIYVLGDYEEKSKYNAHNLKRRYGIKDAILPIPHNLYFAESMNDGEVIDFFYKNMNADSSDYNGNFIMYVNELVQGIITESKIKDY